MNRIIVQALIKARKSVIGELKFFTFFLSIINFYGCEKKQEYVINYHSDGSIFSHGFIKNNKHEGVWVYFGRDGKILAHGIFTDNLREGRWYFYGGNQTVTEYNFNGGIIDGDIVYTRLGDTLEVQHCKMGITKYIEYHNSDGTKTRDYNSCVECSGFQLDILHY